MTTNPADDADGPDDRPTLLTPPEPLPSPPESARGGGRPALTPDCSRCFGLCCVALPFARSADFPVSKPTGTPCLNLATDFSCGIHDRLRERGWKGCTVFDCFGAGQQVSQVTFGGVSWRQAPDTAEAMFAVLPVMHQLHEMLSHLGEAIGLTAVTGTAPDQPLSHQLESVRDQIDAATAASAAELLALDLAHWRDRVAPLLRRTSERVRTVVRREQRIGPVAKRFRPGVDLAGTDLRGLDLRTADLRGAVLIGADLRSTDLRWADLLGADLRDADTAGARFEGALYLTRPQVASTRQGPSGVTR